VSFVQAAVELPFSKLNGELEGVIPLLILGLIVKADVERVMLLQRVVVDGHQDEAVIVFVLADAQHVVLEVVCRDLGAAFRKEQVLLVVQPEHLLLPAAGTEAMRPGQLAQHSRVGGDGSVEGLFLEVTQIPHHSQVVLHLLLPAQRRKGLFELARHLLLLGLLVALGDAAVGANGALAAVEKYRDVVVEVQARAKLLFLPVLPQAVQLLHR
jgi:hypothetical protein